MAKDKPSSKAKVKLTKSAFFQELATATDTKKADVVKFYEALHTLVHKHLGPKGPGEITLPGICKLTAIRTKADKGGKLKPNPFKPGEMMTTKPKPARTKLKARGLKVFLESINK